MGVQKEILTRTPAYLGTVKTIAADGTETTAGLAGATGTLALGVPGNIFDASPARIHTATLVNDAQIGTCVTGEGVIVNPREYALKGDGVDPLAPSLWLSTGMVASFMTFGHVVVYLKEANSVFTNMEGSIIVGAPPEYDTTADYAVGDRVIHSGTLYTCNTAITGGETWTAGHWTAMTSGDDTTDLCVLEINGFRSGR